ncbi:MAG: sigma-54-dependent Fis family transcriptional regulator [Hyphomicrobiales bacterium]|nr:sigma-54-dependent Fis family transcriptional regulator [Hyphomicrobiales bacterium]
MRLLIVGSLKGQLGAASQIAQRSGATVACADDADVALNYVRSAKGADMMLVDVSIDVAELIVRLQAERIAIPVVACGVGNDPRTAVAAIKAGAKDFIPLPPDPELIAAVLTAVANDSQGFIYTDPNMGSVIKLASRVAKSEAGILIVGPSGTGKEVMARYVHAQSNRAAGPFVAVNCAAIPETLLESELFGHEKGAFTGAVARRLGRFEEAQNGTLLLDEISEIAPQLQAKLLRAIQEREIVRVGGGAPIKVNARILATSNRNLQQMVRDGGFREDLYFRLNVVTITIPALRDRPQDIPLLANHFVEKYAEANGLGPCRLSDEAMRSLQAYPWPGNVRELENAMHRAVLISDGDTIDRSAITLTEALVDHNQNTSTCAPVTTGLVGRTVADVERDLIVDTLQHCLGNRTHAATILGISIRTLRNKLRQYTDEGVAVPTPGQPL